MEITERVIGGVRVLDLRGKFTGGEGDVKLKRRVDDLVDAGYNRIVINMAGVPYVDSSALGEIVRCFSSARKAGGRLKLSNPGLRVRDLLSLTKLDTVLDTYSSEAEAIATFGDQK